jgi:hypothetical protein
VKAIRDLLRGFQHIPAGPGLGSRSRPAHIAAMRLVLFILATFLAAPAAAGDDPLAELRRQLEALSGEAQGSVLALILRFGPLLEEFGATLGDLSNYEAPEILPNGDILIRRKHAAPALPDPPPAGVEEGSTDL